MRTGGRPTPFVIFATQRTGSNWLMGLLDADPSITVHDELFLPRALGEDYAGRTDTEFFEASLARRRRAGRLARASWTLRYLDTVYAPGAGADAIGMKLMYGQLWKNPAIWIHLLRRRVRVVHLVRRNLLDVVVSGETAAARKQFHATLGESVQTPTVRLEPDVLLSTLRTLEFRVNAARGLLRILPLQSVEVTYEELIADPRRVEEVFAFLGFNGERHVSSESRFRKLNTAAKTELISNHDEVKQSLAGTRFEQMLDA